MEAILSLAVLLRASQALLLLSTPHSEHHFFLRVCPTLLPLEEVMLADIPLAAPLLSRQALLLLRTLLWENPISPAAYPTLAFLLLHRPGGIIPSRFPTWMVAWSILAVRLPSWAVGLRLLQGMVMTTAAVPSLVELHTLQAAMVRMGDGISQSTFSRVRFL